MSWSDGMLYIETWCVGDMREVVQAHPALDPHHLMSQVVMFISSNVGPPVSPLPLYHDLWGDPAEDSWSEEACQQRGVKVHVGKTTILEPEGEKDSLRARWDRLFEAKDRQGKRMVTALCWRKQTGEEYVWRDGWIHIKR